MKVIREETYESPFFNGVSLFRIYQTDLGIYLICPSIIGGAKFEFSKVRKIPFLLLLYLNTDCFGNHSEPDTDSRTVSNQ